MRPVRLALAVIVVIVSVAAAGALFLRNRQLPVASPTSAAVTSPTLGVSMPTTPAPSVPQASAGVPQGGVLDERLGFVVTDDSGNARVRSETARDPVATFRAGQISVSPDGRQIAYSINDVDPATPPGIRVRPAAGGTERAVADLAHEEAVTRIAWSNDGTGLVVSTGRGTPIGGGIAEATLRTIELSTGVATVVARRTDGRSYWPVAWERASRIVAALEVGDRGGATAYVAIDLTQAPLRVSSVPIQGTIAPLSVRASGDAKYVVSTDVVTFVGRWWPIADYTSAKSLPGGAHYAAAWRPGTSQIGWVEGPTGAGIPPGQANELVLYDVGSGVRVVVTRDRALTGSQLRGFRSDGSAAILVSHSAGDAVVLDIATGATAPVSDSAVIGPSVRLR